MSSLSILDLSPDDSTLVLTAHYAFAPERVFAAWLDPVAMTKWIRPSPECKIEVLRFEPTVGGVFEVRMMLDEGTFGYSGRFTVIETPHRLEMTWLWEPHDDDPYPETHLTVELQPNASGTQLTLTHSKLRSLESRDAHGEGWSTTLRSFAAYLENL